MAYNVVSSIIYYKRDAFNVEIVTFPFLGGYVPRSFSFAVYISQLIREYALMFVTSAIESNLLLLSY